MRNWARWLVGALVLLAVAGVAILAFAYAEARSDPRVRTLALPVANWPAGQKPVRVALLSDIHVGGLAMDAERLSRIVDQVNAQRPDLVVIAGDFVSGHDAAKAERYARQLSAPLAALRAPLGVVAVPGNHDHWTVLPQIRAALEQAGVTVLANGAVRRGPVLVLGVDDDFTGHADTAATLRAARGLGGVPIILTHAPDLIDRLPRGMTGLMLAGHTHCGQVALPLLGVPGNRGGRIYNPRYGCGVVRAGGRTLIVTAGLGTSVAPLRLGAPPDWWLVTLGPAPR